MHFSWGIYGQLGHGNCESVPEPKVVAFFKAKKILQVSLGHAHSLVLCQATSNPKDTELYVFGSNHFGQLGIGTGSLSTERVHSNISSDDEMHCSSQVKSLMPLKLNVCTEKIRLIHTKFVSNLAVDENGHMYTWGSSPQALRLANQIKRRANAKQKMEENQRREMTKRFEATFSNETTNAQPPSGASTSKCAYAEAPKSMANEIATSILTDLIDKTDIPTTVAELSNKVTTKTDENEEITSNETLVEVLASSVTISDHEENEHLKEEGIKDILVEEITAAATAAIQLVDNLVEELVEEVKPMVSQPLKTLKPILQVADEVTAKIADNLQQSSIGTAAADVDPCEHMTPHFVDTTEVAGQILQISSGLFHFALISSTCTLYTWGKNLEHQLGTVDKERRAVNKPSPVDCVDRPMYVDCGADFTLVMTTEYVVKAFGGNSNGQCGRDLGPSIEKIKQRVVCLPTTKRLMRFESQCVDVPVEINLPRPRIRLESDPVRYLKSIPKYQLQFMQEAGISFDDAAANFERPSPSNQYKSTTQADSSENVVTGQDSDEMISSLENLSNNEANDGSLNFSLLPSVGATAGPIPTPTVIAAAPPEDAQHSAVVDDITPDEQSYARLPVTDNSDTSCAIIGQQCAEQCPLVSAPQLDPSGEQTPQAVSSQSTLTSNAHTVEGDESVEEDINLQQLRQYIHYCLYVFHGLYNPDKVCDFSKQRLEYRIRTLMLNFKFIDAFVLCLQNCNSTSKSLKIFAYFTKDTGFVPIVFEICGKHSSSSSLLTLSKRYDTQSSLRIQIEHHNFSNTIDGPGKCFTHNALTNSKGRYCWTVLINGISPHKRIIESDPKAHCSNLANFSPLKN